MSTKLASLVQDLSECSGIRRKEAIGRILRSLEGAWDFGRTVIGPGDDAAALRMEGRDRYLLVAADGILPSLIAMDPCRAGRSAVLVNANDIYAMGGRPLAMVNVLGGVSLEQQEEICRGMREECRRLRVPMVGGHVVPEGNGPFLAVSVVGEARSLLSDRKAEAGQEVVLALDLRGERWSPDLLNWDSHGRKDSETVIADLEVLCSLGEEGLGVAAKDVSNAGIVGTLAMLLEQAGLGAKIHLDRIVVPAGFSLAEWLKVYPSYGFLVVCKRVHLAATTKRFADRGIWAEGIGSTDASRKLCLCLGDEEALLLDFTKRGILRTDRFS